MGKKHAYRHLYCAIYMPKAQRLIIRPYLDIIPTQSE